WDKAARHFRQAGIKAAARWAHREAIQSFEQALVALDHMPEDEQARSRAIDVRFDLRNSLQPLGEFERMMTYLREAETLAEPAGDLRRVGRALSFLANHFRVMGDHLQSLAAAQRVAGIAARVGDPSLQFLSTMRLGDTLTVQGQYQQACDLYARNHVLL